MDNPQTRRRRRQRDEENGLTRNYHITFSREHGICCLFFWGCNLGCRICLLQKEAFDCHLPETRLKIYDPDYTGERPERFLALSELTRFLDPLPLKRTILMGAEPLCDPRLPDILGYLKEERHSAVTLLTNGKALPPFSLVDEVIFSLKALEPSLHRDYTGDDNREILENFRAIAVREDISLQTETVFIPGYVDEGEVLDIATFIASVDPTLPLRIDAYLPVSGLPWRAPESWQIEALAEKARAILPNTTFLHGRGGEEVLAYEVERIF